MSSRWVVLLLGAVSLVGQTGLAPTGVRHNYKPGDTLRYTVTFDGDPNFHSVAIIFQSNSVPPDQSGLRSNFDIEHSERTSRGIFEVDGTIPANAATGTYLLSVIQTRIDPQGVKDYDAKAFHETVDVDNSTKYEFPPLKSVVPK